MFTRLVIQEPCHFWDTADNQTCNEAILLMPQPYISFWIYFFSCLILCSFPHIFSAIERKQTHLVLPSPTSNELREACIAYIVPGKNNVDKLSTIYACLNQKPFKFFFFSFFLSVCLCLLTYCLTLQVSYIKEGSNILKSLKI